MTERDLPRWVLVRDDDREAPDVSRPCQVVKRHLTWTEAVTACVPTYDPCRGMIHFFPRHENDLRGIADETGRIL